MKNCFFISIVSRSVCIKLKVYDGRQQQVDETTLSQPVTFIHPLTICLLIHLNTLVSFRLDTVRSLIHRSD